MTAIVFLFFFSPSAQSACQCPPLSAQEQQEQATLAFTGKISDIRTDKKTKVQTIVFDVLDFFKGTPGDEVALTDTQAGTDCRIDFKEGDSYLVYTRWEWGAVVTSRCYGTKLLDPSTLDAKTLGPSDAVKEKYYDQLQKLCMGRIDTPCCLASLKAMRKGYYVPEPEEGCPSGTVPDRLKCHGSMRWCVPASAP